MLYRVIVDEVEDELKYFIVKVDVISEINVDLIVGFINFIGYFIFVIYINFNKGFVLLKIFKFIVCI